MKNISAYKCGARNFCSIYKYPVREDSYNKTPEYPPILSLEKKATTRRAEESWYKKIERQETVEEKLFEINMPRYYGWNCLMMKETEIPYNSLNFTQYVTRTAIFDSGDLPEPYSFSNELAKQLASSVKACLKEEISFQMAIQ